VLEIEGGRRKNTTNLSAAAFSRSSSWFSFQLGWVRGVKTTGEEKDPTTK
jgi:hypothetical protein